MQPLKYQKVLCEYNFLVLQRLRNSYWQTVHYACTMWSSDYSTEMPSHIYGKFPRTCIFWTRDIWTMLCCVHGYLMCTYIVLWEIKVWCHIKCTAVFIDTRHDNKICTIMHKVTVGWCKTTTPSMYFWRPHEMPITPSQEFYYYHLYCLCPMLFNNTMHI